MCFCSNYGYKWRGRFGFCISNCFHLSTNNMGHNFQKIVSMLVPSTFDSKWKLQVWDKRYTYLSYLCLLPGIFKFSVQTWHGDIHRSNAKFVLKVLLKIDTCAYLKTLFVVLILWFCQCIELLADSLSLPPIRWTIFGFPSTGIGKKGIKHWSL